MSRDTTATDEMPKFESTLPPGLLEGRSEGEQYMYRSQNEMQQAIGWLAQKMSEQSERLEAVHEQAKRTNGTVAQAKADITELTKAIALQKDAIAAQQKLIEPVVKTHGIAMKLVKSKYTWLVLLAFLFIGIPTIVAVTPAPAVMAKFLFGAFGVGS